MTEWFEQWFAAVERERGAARVVGFDLSQTMLHRAGQRTRAALVRGDMRRLPFRSGSFTLAVNLFTSFGYFREDVAGVLTPGGRFVLDYLNADRVRQQLPRTTEEIRESETSAWVKRRFSQEGRFVVKDIELRDEGGSFQERVRLFAPAELAALFTSAWLTVIEQFGDYDGSPLSAGSPRAILVGVHS